MSQTLQSVLCITTNKYLVHVLVVLLHARFSVVGPIPFLLAAIFFSVHPYIGSTVLVQAEHGGASCHTVHTVRSIARVAMVISFAHAQKYERYVPAFHCTLCTCNT